MFVDNEVFLCLWQKEEDKDCEESEEYCKRKERVGVKKRNQHQRKHESHREVGGPIDEHHDGGGGRSGA